MAPPNPAPDTAIPVARPLRFCATFHESWEGVRRDGGTHFKVLCGERHVEGHSKTSTASEDEALEDEH